MSVALYGVGGLRWWGEDELRFRDHCARALSLALVRALWGLNRAWRFEQVEGPALVPRGTVSPAYGDDDLWTTRAGLGEDGATLRAETTATSYAYAQHLLGRGAKLPLCVWQQGRSYRRETNDGASPSKLRFFEFNQLEFQCIYAPGTKADYRAAALRPLAREAAFLVGADTRVVPSERVPSYSAETEDIEAWCGAKGRWFEVASVSTRTDFRHAGLEPLVLEVAWGLDRLVELRGWEAERRAENAG